MVLDRYDIDPQLIAQQVLVQAVKDPMKSKGARLTTEISLPGRFVVFVPSGEGLGVSRRLEDAERTRLRDILKNLEVKQGGVIVRTAAEGASAEDIERDLVFLQRLWKTIETRAKSAKAPALVYQEAELPLRVVRDLFTDDFERAVVDDERAELLTRSGERLRFDRLLVAVGARSAEPPEPALAWHPDGRGAEAFGALLEDLKATGLLNETIVLIGGEFGRTPSVEVSAVAKVHNGRDHNNHGFSVLLAGGGIKGGIAYGATDDLGFKAVDKPVHPHDIHATMLHLLGLDHTRLTYRYSGRDFRLTDVAGTVIQEILA